MEQLLDAEGMLNTVKDDVKNEKNYEYTQNKILFAQALALVGLGNEIVKLNDRIVRLLEEKSGR